MMRHTDLKAVSFDAAGTLIHLAEDVGTSYSRVALRHGIEVESNLLNRSFRAVWKRTPPPFSPDASRIDRDERSWWSSLVREVFREAGETFSDEDQFAAFFDALYLHFEEPGTWRADPHSHRIVNQVSARWRPVISSNFDHRLRRILDDLRLLNSFERLFLSCEMGVSKPDPRFFKHVSTELGVEPQAILHVGDDPQCDWIGAESAGFRHFRVGPGEGSLLTLLD